MVTDCHRLPMVPMVPIVLTSAPMVSVADVSVKLYRRHYGEVNMAKCNHSPFKYTCNTIQYNSRLLKISKLTKATTAITGYNIAYSDTNQLMFPHRKQSTANT